MTNYSAPTLVDTDPDTMFQEIEASEKSREIVLKDYDRLLSNMNATEEWPEPLSFEYLAYMIPRIVQDNPTVAVNSRVGSDELVQDQAMVQLQMAVQSGAMLPEQANMAAQQLQKPGNDAMAAQHVLKRMIEQDDDRALLDLECSYFLKAFAASITRMEPMRDQPGRYWPRTYLVDPRRLLLDPAATHPCDLAWNGHWDLVSKPALEKRAKDDVDGQGGWNLKAIKQLTTQKNDKAGVDRHEVRVYELWVPGLNTNEMGDPDINGTLITLGSKRDGSETKGLEIRKPRPAYVPPWGAYTLFGCYHKMGTAWPISPLLATFHKQTELQKHAKAMNTNARKYKRVVIVSDSNPMLVQQLRDAPDHLVIGVKDDQFTKDKVISQEIGGISDQQLVMYAQMLGGFDRAIGMDDQQRGRVDKDATATAVAVADESVATRVSYIEGKFITGVRNQLRTRLWFASMDDRFSCRLGKEASKEFGMIDPWFIGGLDNNEAFDFDDLELVLDPYSMGRVSEQALQRRVSEFIQTLVALAPVMRQFPEIDWEKVLRSLTQVLNLPGMDGAIDFQAMQQLGAMQMQMGTAQQAVEMDGQQAANDASRVKTLSNAQELIQNRVGGNIGNLNYKGAR